jgi:hypothetical protein
MGNAYAVLAGEPEGKRPLVKPRCKREDNIKMDLKDVMWDYVEWIHMARDMHWRRAFVNSVVNFRV